jgi:hypothetical protein
MVKTMIGLAPPQAQGTLATVIPEAVLMFPVCPSQAVFGAGGVI